MKKVFSLPADNGAEPARWGYIGVSGDRLIAGRDFVPFASAFPQTAVSPEETAATDREGTSQAEGIRRV